MNMKKSSLALVLTSSALALASSIVMPANAFTVTNGGSLAGDGSYLTTSRTGATVKTFNDLSVDGTLYSNYTGGAVKNGNSPSQWAAPANDTTNYYSVGPSTSSPGTITKTSGYWNYFGLYWGSVDDYNTIEFFKDGTSVASYTGAQIAALNIGVVTGGNQSNASSNVYLNFDADNSGEYFNKIVLTSSLNAFESDNHATVPEPLTMLGAGAAVAFGGAFKRKLHNKDKKGSTKA